MLSRGRLPPCSNAARTLQNQQRRFTGQRLITEKRSNGEGWARSDFADRLGKIIGVYRKPASTTVGGREPFVDEAAPIVEATNGLGHVAVRERARRPTVAEDFALERAEEALDDGGIEAVRDRILLGTRRVCRRSKASGDRARICSRGISRMTRLRPMHMPCCRRPRFSVDSLSPVASAAAARC